MPIRVVEKILHIIWGVLLDYDKIEWQQTLKDLERAPDVAYDDVLKKFDLVWCVENLIACGSNLIVTWRDRRIMGIDT